MVIVLHAVKQIKQITIYDLVCLSEDASTIKASQAVVLNENSVVVTQRKLMLTAI